MITSKGGNMTTVKLQNRALILNVIRNVGAVSRLDIAEQVQLTPAAITILVNEMVKEGIITEVGQLEEPDKRSGRKKVLIDINYDFKNVIGINIESDTINIGVSNIKGEIIVHKRMPVDKTIPPRELLERISSECMNILWKENILKENILGVGVGIVGPVDEETGVSKHAYGIWNEEVPVKDMLQEALGLRVIVDNNVRTLALGELDYHTKDEQSNILFIKYGPGIGSAMIINNNIYYGSNNQSGEIGHTIVELEGDICRCGKRGCLETIAAEKVIMSKVGKRFSKENTPKLYEICKGDASKINSNTVYHSIKENDTEVINIINRGIKFMALAIANAVSLFDPDKVIMYGEAFKQDFVIRYFKKILLEILASDNIDEFITLSELNYKSNYIGGIALALREFFYSTGGN